jgi:hypothetical protein
MKPAIFLVLSIYCSGVYAQRNTGTPSSSITSFNSTNLGGGNDAFVYGRGIDINSYQYIDVNGSPFLKQAFTPAYVVFKNGAKFSQVPVKFDMLHNEIDFEKDGTLLSMIGLDSISYPDSIYQNMIFKTGYPSLNKHDTSSIYQVVAQNDKIQLLKYYDCHISVVKSLGFPDKTSFDVDDQYYLFNKATKAFEEVKLNKKSFSSGLVGMGYSKAKLDKDKNIDFKNEKEVADLIRSLNL